MKLEPVALSAHMTDAQIYAGLFECDALERVGYSEEMLQAVRRLIDSAIPEGYVVVPVEPNEEMLEAGCEGYRVAKGDRKTGMGELALEIYKAMICDDKLQSSMTNPDLGLTPPPPTMAEIERLMDELVDAAIYSDVPDAQEAKAALRAAIRAYGRE